jgi:outer membrane lipoprotein-sorting protein
MKLNFAILCVLALALPAAAAETTEAILARLDANAPTFRSIEGGYRRVKHTAIINDDAEESGTLRMVKTSGKTRVLIDLTKPDPKLYALSDKVEIFFPKINTVQEFDLGKQKGLVDQFLLLGFGSSGKDLAKNYTVKAIGEESVDGQMATKLELVPKSAKSLEYINKVEVWIPTGLAHAVRQKVYEKSGDTMTFYYSALKLNSGIGASAVELKLPAGVKREFPGR